MSPAWPWVPLLGALLACRGPDPVAPTAPPAGPAADLDQGQQDPPLPADNPAWRWDAGGFVADPGWYGEPGWPEVRMRAAGHLAAAGRDLARIHATAGDLPSAAAAYERLAGLLEAIPSPPDGVAAEIVGLLRAGARRDAALAAALAQGAAPPDGPGLAGLRGVTLDLCRRAHAGQDTAEAARGVQAALLPYLEPRPDLDLGAFSDFTERHRLRVRLVEAWQDAEDPLGIEERWGTWAATEIRRQALILGATAGECGGDPWEERARAVLVGTWPPPGPHALRRPSELADALRDPDQIPHFSAEELGSLPTGDSLLDVAGFPGPRAIGRLQRRGLDDPEHRAWLDRAAVRLGQTLPTDPAAVLAQGRELAAWLDEDPHDSRYYNVKQLRNALVRQFARAGRHDLAAEALRDARPLHNQDWACPNREGILLAIEGRLLAETGSGDAARTLEASLAASLAFLAQVDAAAARPAPAP